MAEDLLGILSDKTILYAEDEPGIRRNIAETLELFFMEVVTVEDGQAVLDVYPISRLFTTVEKLMRAALKNNHILLTTTIETDFISLRKG